MSLSKPINTNTNPAVKFFQWSGSEGKIKYYDKEKGENVYLDVPFTFIKLDTLASVTGYSDADESGYWSNEVRSLKESLIVKTNKGIKKEGLWENIAEGLKSQGAKFASSVYVAYLNEDGKLELCNFKFFGSSIKEWINFVNENKIKDGDGVVIDGCNSAKKGSNKYFTPTFSKINISAKQLEEATELDKELQIYLDSYFDYSNKYSNEKVKSATANGTDELEYSGVEESTVESDDDIPF